MNNFIFQNSTKAYFGKGCVNEFLESLSNEYGDNIMLTYGGGSIKKNGIYDEIICFKENFNKNQKFTYYVYKFPPSFVI